MLLVFFSLLFGLALACAPQSGTADVEIRVSLYSNPRTDKCAPSEELRTQKLMSPSAVLSLELSKYSPRGVLRIRKLRSPSVQSLELTNVFPTGY